MRVPNGSLKSLSERGALFRAQNYRPRQANVQRELGPKVTVQETVNTRSLLIIITIIILMLILTPRNQICKERQLLFGGVPWPKLAVRQANARERNTAHSRYR